MRLRSARRSAVTLRGETGSCLGFARRPYLYRDLFRHSAFSDAGIPIRSAGTQIIADHGRLLPQLLQRLGLPSSP